MHGLFSYVAGKKQHGPVSFEELKQLAVRDKLKRRDKVWCKSMTAWQQADAVSELFDDLPPDLESKQLQTIR